MYGYNVETTAISIQRVLQYSVIMTLQYEMKKIKKREKHKLANLILNNINVHAIRMKRHVTIVMLYGKNLHNNYSVFKNAIPILCYVHDMRVMRETMNVISHFILQIHSCTML